MSKVGKIISVVGGPRAGKSFLVKLLAQHYNGVAILEGEESDFPERIRIDIQENIRPLERITWFRNKLVKEYLGALEKKEEGSVVVTDNFWISYQLYIDALAKDFESEVIYDLATIDKQTLPWPDVVIFLSLEESGIRDFIKRGGRDFDQSEEFIQNQALPIHKLHTSFFNRDEIKPKVLTIQRDQLDFLNESDFESLISKIENGS
ncbi:MAG: deoxynucleoside kinase [Candidatus Pacebacteria bacterium]|nr:deoxynucleoside kinase [Candidatus Paceibacterota bacterium]MCF7857145.1 deoxynucleoside kinase [Candidatus Paceibacterota bacterium]